MDCLVTIGAVRCRLSNQNFLLYTVTDVTDFQVYLILPPASTTIVFVSVVHIPAHDLSRVLVELRHRQL